MPRTFLSAGQPYLNPPDHVMVLTVDKKSQIQALSRTQLVLPWDGLSGRASPDYGITTQLATLDIATGPSSPDFKPRPRASGVSRYLKRIDAGVCI
jgi:hypothetical protein